jgi:hypothetical protein
VGTGKRRVVMSYKNLSPELLELLKQRYPLGWSDYVMKINKSETDFFHAIMLDTDDASYLIKVDVKIDTHGLDDDDLVVDSSSSNDDEIADSGDDDEEEEKPRKRSSSEDDDDEDEDDDDATGL